MQPSIPLSQVLPAAAFAHPQANRELRLGDAVVAYRLERARRRSIGFTVGPDGLAVRAPSWVTLGAVDAALRDKSDWILRKLHEARERRQRLEHARIAWHDGTVLPYLGAPMQVVQTQAPAGSSGVVDLVQSRQQVKAALVGFVPDEETGEPVTFLGGELVEFGGDGRMWWADEFHVKSYYRSNP